MIEIKISNYSDWKMKVSSDNLDHFSYIESSEYKLISIDGMIVYTHELDDDDVENYESMLLGKCNKKLGNYYSREPFASKVLKDGTKLFRRKYGVKETIGANSEKDIIFTVPYAKAKINKVEVISANALDRIDLFVKSPVDEPTATAYGMPTNYLLNQFGFNVIVSDLLYSDKSDYDADVFAGMQVVIRYKNDTNENKSVGFNLIYHEVV